MKDLHLEKNMNPQVAILYATVTDTFKRLQKLVEGTDVKELSFKGSENNENSISDSRFTLGVPFKRRGSSTDT